MSITERRLLEEQVQFPVCRNSPVTTAARSIIAHAKQEIHRKVECLCDEIKILRRGLLLSAAPIGDAGGGDADGGGKLPLRDLFLTKELRKAFRKLVVHIVIILP